MRRRPVLLIAFCVVLLSSLVLFTGCRKGQRADTEHTDTMAPATPPPTATADTDAPATQTVEIGDERSPNEGGALSPDEPAEQTSTVPPATTTHPKVAPKKK